MQQKVPKFKVQANEKINKINKNEVSTSNMNVILNCLPR